MNIDKKVLKEMVLKELAEFTAIRKIEIKAQEASLDFEKILIAHLNLVEPDELDLVGQKQYLRIALQLKKDILAAVYKTSKALLLSGIPKKQADKPKTTK